MVKLPISDYVAGYYKEQGIEFTFCQQATLCWNYHSLLENQLKSLRDILSMSDDEKLNKEIAERVEYEEKAYECFMTNHDSAIFYVFHPDNKGEYDEGYFSTAEAALSFGTRHCDREFSIDKCYFLDRYPKELSEGETIGEINPIRSTYYFTSEGDIKYGWSRECPAPFHCEDGSRFENRFLNIKSPFGLGDIVMGPDLKCPAVVSTGHDCFMEHYDRLKDREYIQFDTSDNCIRTDWIGADGTLYYDHTVPFDLWKIDSWEDKEYWELLQMMSAALKEGIDLYGFDMLCYRYGRRNREKKDG